MKRKVTQFDATCIHVFNDDCIRILLTYVLALGNFLNSNPKKKDVVGLQLDSIERIADVTSIDGKENLLMYVIRKAEADTQRELVDP